MKYRKKPVDAVQWTGSNFSDIGGLNCAVWYGVGEGSGVIWVAWGRGEKVLAKPRDYIVMDCLGAITAIKPDIFEKTYEAVEEDKMGSKCRVCGNQWQTIYKRADAPELYSCTCSCGVSATIEPKEDMEQGELVRVVRCKDCMFNDGQYDKCEYLIDCAYHLTLMSAYGYCYAGTRKEEEFGMDWDTAKTHLDSYITQYERMGASSSLRLVTKLLPLKARYDQGERSQELYKEIMRFK